MSIGNFSDCLQPGFRLGDYCIKSVLGRGAFGITYLADDERDNTPVVIKESMPIHYARRHPRSFKLSPKATGETEQNFIWAMEHFYNEAILLQKFKHPNIVSVNRVMRALGTVYYVMPYIGGTSLDKLIVPGRSMSEDVLLPILIPILHALHYIHSNRLYHLDIKPHNIILTNSLKPVLIDFGTARFQSQHTQSYTYSDGFAPIEQMQDNQNIGEWTDLYALGATMLCLITCAPVPRSIDRIAGSDPIPTLLTHPKISPYYSAAFLGGIDIALALHHKDRWQNAAEWLHSFGYPATATPKQTLHFPLSETEERQDHPVDAPSAPVQEQASAKSIALSPVFMFGYIVTLLIAAYISNSSSQLIPVLLFSWLTLCMSGFFAILLTMQNRRTENIKFSIFFCALHNALMLALVLLISFISGAAEVAGMLFISLFVCYVAVLCLFLRRKLQLSIPRIIGCVVLTILTNSITNLIINLVNH